MSPPTVVAFVATWLIVGGLATLAPEPVVVGALVVAILGWLGYWLVSRRP